MPFYVLTTTERSAFETNAPTSARIDAAIGSLRIYNSTMVGPRPRIVRRVVVGQFSAWETQVSWLIERPTDQPLSVVQNYAAERTANALRPLGAWTPVSVTAWSEAVNGPVSWWASGEAARTRTRDAFPTGAARLEASQNPIGPDSRDVRPSTAGEIVGDAAAAAGRAAREAALPIGLLVVGAAAVAAGVVFWPEISLGLKHRFSTPKAKSNPFAGYDNFEACERSARARGVRDSGAYCGAIKRRAEGNPSARSLADLIAAKV